MKSFATEKASTIEKSSSPLRRLLWSRVLRRARDSITLRKILTPKSHRQRVTNSVLLLCGCLRCALIVVVALRCDTQIHTRKSKENRRAYDLHLNIIFFYSRAIDRFFRHRNPTTKHTFFHIIVSFFLQTHTPTYVDVVFRWPTHTPHAYTERQTHTNMQSRIFFFLLSRAVFVSFHFERRCECEWARENEWM